MNELIPVKAWWVIHADEMRHALYRVYDGEHPEDVWMEMLVNSEFDEVESEEE